MMKLCLVSGAGGNLGKAVVESFLQKGYRVIGFISPRDQEPVKSGGEQLEWRRADLLDEAAVKTALDEIKTKYGRIDVAVLTAGGYAGGSMQESSTALVTKQYQLNFETAYNVARPVFEIMLLQDYGRIFMIGSKAGLDGHQAKGKIAYGLSKSLIFRLAEIMNAEAGQRNVVSTVVVPSTIDTPQNRDAMPDADPSRWVKASEIAELIAYYASDASASLREPVLKVYNKA
jgi:NAD(P)-dependent dehydrogenase (short-subunit alcohol dehydrogenase family)